MRKGSGKNQKNSQEVFRDRPMDYDSKKWFGAQEKGSWETPNERMELGNNEFDSRKRRGQAG